MTYLNPAVLCMAVWMLKWFSVSCAIGEVAHIQDVKEGVKCGGKLGCLCCLISNNQGQRFGHRVTEYVYSYLLSQALYMLYTYCTISRVIYTLYVHVDYTNNNLGSKIHSHLWEWCKVYVLIFELWYHGKASCFASVSLIQLLQMLPWNELAILLQRRIIIIAC